MNDTGGTIVELRVRAGIGKAWRSRLAPSGTRSQQNSQPPVFPKHYSGVNINTIRPNNLFVDI